MVTLVGLWCYLDDHGRGEDEPGMIKAEVWPRRKNIGEREVARHLNEIAAKNLICRYSVAGESLIHIPSWREHQKVSHPQKESVPPCQVHDGSKWDEFVTGGMPHLDRFATDSRIIPESVGAGVGGGHE